MASERSVLPLMIHCSANVPCVAFTRRTGYLRYYVTYIFTDPSKTQGQHNTDWTIHKAAVTTEILNKLSISIETLPQKSQQILQQAAEYQTSMDLVQLDPIAVSLQHTKHISENLTQEYQMLKLKQKNAELQAKIDRNNKFLEELRKDLECSKDSLMKQTPNPDNIHEHIRQLKLKVASYEENCEKAKIKYSKLSVPDCVLPKSTMALVSTLASLRDEAAALRRRAEDVALAREARETLNRLRR